MECKARTRYAPHRSIEEGFASLVLCCRTYEVTGAAKALRGMWPLVFSKVEAVREAVLDSWKILHLHNRTNKEQVRRCLGEGRGHRNWS